MRHPFQTDTFDPGDPAVIQRTEHGKQLNDGFHIGPSAWEVDGSRWILLHSPYPHPCPYRFDAFNRLLTYPMPDVYGDEPHKAMNAFERAFQAERMRIWALEPPPVQALASRQPSTPAAPDQDSKQPRRSPKGRPIALAGAVPLPGLEPWTGYGRRG